MILMPVLFIGSTARRRRDIVSAVTESCSPSAVFARKISVSRYWGLILRLASSACAASENDSCEFARYDLAIPVVTESQCARIRAGVMGGRLARDSRRQLLPAIEVSGSSGTLPEISAPTR